MMWATSIGLLPVPGEEKSKLDFVIIRTIIYCQSRIVQSCLTIQIKMMKHRMLPVRESEPILGCYPRQTLRYMSILDQNPFKIRSNRGRINMNQDYFLLCHIDVRVKKTVV